MLTYRRVAIDFSSGFADGKSAEEYNSSKVYEILDRNPHNRVLTPRETTTYPGEKSSKPANLI